MPMGISVGRGQAGKPDFRAGQAKGRPDQESSKAEKGPGKGHGLPPGLQKKLDRGDSLPPGIQKKLDRGGSLPPGLQNRSPDAGTQRGSGQSTASSAPTQTPVSSNTPAQQAPVDSRTGNSSQTGQSGSNGLFVNPNATSTVLGGQVLNRPVARPDPTQIIDRTVLGNLKSGNTAGFIGSLAGNVQESLNYSANLFLQLTA